MWFPQSTTGLLVDHLVILDEVFSTDGCSVTLNIGK